MGQKDVFPAALCPIRTLIECLADKWALLIMYWLHKGPRRFSQLRRDIPGISQKMLSQTLKRLERDGLVSRGPIGDSAVAVEYRLTPLSEELKVPMTELAQWAEQNVSAIHAARDAFDRVDRSQP